MRKFFEEYKREVVNNIYILVTVVIIFIVYGIVGYVDTHSSFIGEVTYVEGNFISVQAGEQIYGFEGEGFKVGDTVKCYVTDYGTPTVIDDEITDVKVVESR